VSTPDIDPIATSIVQATAEQTNEAIAIVTRPDWKITSDTQSITIGQLLLEVKAKIKQLDETRKRLAEPALETQRRINAFFAQGLDPLKRLEAIMKSGLSSFQQMREAERRTAMLAAVVVPPPPVDVPGITYRVSRDFRVVDADRVPREYCSPDRDKIKASRTEEIPGVEFFEVSKPVVRPR
jgi:hypothetical protein